MRQECLRMKWAGEAVARAERAIRAIRAIRAVRLPGGVDAMDCI